MPAALKFKPRAEQVRVIFGEGAHLSGMDHVRQQPGKVYAVIGPFEDHCDKGELQDMLTTVLRGYNTVER